MKKCKKCNVDKPINEFRFIRKNKNGTDLHKARCNECERKRELEKYHSLSIEKKQERRRKSVEVLEKNYFKRYKLNRHYNLSLEDYNKMYKEQKGKCYLCEKNIVGREIKVDHNHKTGKVRKLLCHNCNTSLGLLKEDIKLFEKCIDYLRQC